MYAEPKGICSLVLHVLIKYPILVIVMGLLGAGAFVTNATKQPNSENFIEAKVTSLATNKEAVALENKAPNTFDAIIKAESSLDKSMLEESKKYFDALTSLGKGPIGVHPDGKSFGPTGLTEIALTDVLRKIPTCEDIAGTNEILNSETTNIQFAYLYFLELIYRYKSVDTAITAYHYGPTRVDAWRKA
ncbi:MAG: transglycosylase SLT domain-containing protein, partial [Thermodesulfovibrionales bacterium]|nr:transglycosylase SLT domain-containing protein [Thermodesulfovibrionales bacterium]